MTFCLLSENYIIIRNETVKIKQMQGKYETTAIDAYNQDEDGKSQPTKMFEIQFDYC